jgi:hypothetical protein
MLLFIVIGIAVAAFLALVVAITSGSLAFAWFTIGVSAAGLLLLLVNEMRRQKTEDAGRDDDVGRSRPEVDEYVDESADEEPSVAAEFVHNEQALHPDIWPPEHPVRDIKSRGDRIEPRPVHEGEAPSPEIWP